MRRASSQPIVDGLQCSQKDGNIMFSVLSVVLIITTLKKHYMLELFQVMHFHEIYQFC
jgi:arginine decarboxylase-like protein